MKKNVRGDELLSYRGHKAINNMVFWVVMSCSSKIAKHLENAVRPSRLKNKRRKKQAASLLLDSL
jgi:hypothetical protein